eukprot:320147_1
MHTINLLNDIITKFTSPRSQQISQYDVIIIGGGCSAIAAARQLSKSKIKCCILEARDRLGGRTQSSYWEDNISIDYGAQWIHHVPSNGNHPLLKLAKNDLNIDVQQDFLQTESRESVLSHRKRLIWDEMTKQEIPTRIYTKITHSIKNTLKKKILSNTFSRNKKHKNYSIYDALKPYYHTTMLGLSNELQSVQQLINDMNENCNIKQFDVSLMERCIDRCICVYECGDSLITDQSLYHYDDDSLGGYNIYMQGRYGEFIKIIANTLDKNKFVDIQLEKTVTCVKYNPDQKCDDFKMEVIVNDSKCNKLIQYKAKHVIVCVPIGCLQARTIEFRPKLKDTFWNSIDNGIGITKCDKVILQFDGQFRDKNNITTIHIINKQERYKQNESIPAENQNYGNGFRMGVDYEDRKKYNIWVIFLSQHYLQRVLDNDEKKSSYDNKDIETQNDFIVKDIVNIFKDIFGDKKLKRYHVSRWSMDEYSLGSWCYLKKGGNGKDDCDVILNGYDIFDIESDMNDNNIEKRLQFAGEYTISDGIGTVLAAFVSGEMAAKKIINIQ